MTWGFSNTSDFDAGPGIHDHHEDYNTGSVWAKGSCWTGFVTLQIGSYVGQYITVPQGYSKMTLSLELSLDNYELSVGAGAGICEADAMWAMLVQRPNHDDADVDEGPITSLVSQWLHNSDITGHWAGAATSEYDFVVHPGETILVVCGIHADAAVLQVGGGAKSDVHGTVRKITARFHN